MSDVKFQPRRRRVIVAERFPRHHHRVPTYVKGRRGVVERLCGVFGNPETLAHHGDGKPAHSRSIVCASPWTTCGRDGPKNRLTTRSRSRLYEHWLEAAQ